MLRPISAGLLRLLRGSCLSIVRAPKSHSACQLHDLCPAGADARSKPFRTRRTEQDALHKKGQSPMPAAIATETQTAAIVNISPEKWPPRYRTYFGSLEIRSPQPGETFAITPVRGCTTLIDLGDKRTHP